MEIPEIEILCTIHNKSTVVKTIKFMPGAIVAAGTCPGYYGVDDQHQICYEYKISGIGEDDENP